MDQQNEKRLRVLITSPSLDETENVSGISTLDRRIIKYGSCEFVHFSARRRVGETAGAVWFLKQISLPIRFIRHLIEVGPAIVQINTALMPLSIYHDEALAICAGPFRRPLVVHFYGRRFLAEKFATRMPAQVVKRMLAWASRVSVLSEFENVTVERSWSVVDALPNAIAVKKAKSRTRSDRPRSMIFFGRIEEMKGLDEMVAACRELKAEDFDFEFNCYGTRPQRDSFVNSIRRALGGSCLLRRSHPRGGPIVSACRSRYFPASFSVRGVSDVSA